jgi:hypothetical protein
MIFFGIDMKIGYGDSGTGNKNSVGDEQPQQPSIVMFQCFGFDL